LTARTGGRWLPADTELGLETVDVEEEKYACDEEL
jgi:hypothetical protein